MAIVQKGSIVTNTTTTRLPLNSITSGTNIVIGASTAGPLGRQPRGDDWPVTMHATMEGRLHCEDGPALVYADGQEFFFINGVRVTEKIVKGEIAREDILNADNQEVRRVMVEKVGPREFRKMFKPITLKADQYGTLVEFPDIKDDVNPEYGNWLVRQQMGFTSHLTRVYSLMGESRKERKEREKFEASEKERREKELESAPPEFLPYLAVHVTDPSTEREYYLRVPAEFRGKTPREAVAWTFNIPAKDYHPLQEA